ncbi:hypothetical protein BB560_003529 [Smittium megazygosporum]|uniref:fumarate reductase (NADH) n=1 Tax=Smittium megazygosporum TaxID=133381 RepID=A0A2T9ZBP9_9FUNG|nr:hypothetical protein BB560_003529 [Smittium megazygosporum]
MRKTRLVTLIITSLVTVVLFFSIIRNIWPAFEHYSNSKIPRLVKFGQKSRMDSSKNHVVIIGGGLAGMSAAIEAYLKSPSTKVTLFDKEPKLGGNSAKASSGINGVHTITQKQFGVQDSVDLFSQDTIRSGRGLSDPGLVNKLVVDSTESVSWLQDFFKLDLDVLARLGGHSARRTHRRPDLPDGRPQPVGFGITKTLSSWIEKEASTSNGRLSLNLDAKVVKLLTDTNGDVNGIEILKKNVEGEIKENVFARAVVLATGGFAGEGANAALLKQYAEQYYGLPTTNGPWATGDGVLLGQDVGAGIVDMDQVQVHPTAFVSSKDPYAQTKFLAAEALRGEGGVLLNFNGKRFVNELDTRDNVTSAIWEKSNSSDLIKNIYGEDPQTESKPTSQSPNSSAFLILSKEAADKFGMGALNFYMKMGLIHKAESLGDLSEKIQVPKSTLLQEFIKYEAAKAGIIKDEFGKSTFPASILSPKDSNLDDLFKSVDWSDPSTLLTTLKSSETSVGSKDVFYWGIITPALHYTMGGLLFNNKAQVLRSDKTPINGLFAAGEVTGGLHGKNRLGGNSLLECVVFGREAGKRASDYTKSMI